MNKRLIQSGLFCVAALTYAGVIGFASYRVGYNEGVFDGNRIGFRSAHNAHAADNLVKMASQFPDASRALTQSVCTGFIKATECPSLEESRELSFSKEPIKALQGKSCMDTLSQVSSLCQKS